MFQRRLENIVNDSTLRELLSNSWDSDFESRAAAESYTELTSTRQQDTSIASAAIYTYNEQLAGHGDFLSINGEVTATPWFRKAASTSAVFWQTLQRDDRYGNTYWELNMFRQIPLPSSRSYAILVLTASDNYLKNRINNSSLDCIITVNQDPVFFSTEKENNGKPIPLEVDYEQYSYMTSGVLSLDGSDTMSAVNTLLPFKSDDKIYIVSYNPEALSSIYRIQTDYSMILIFAILLPCLLMYLFIRYFSARVTTLRSAMHQASQGNYNIMDSFHGNDELSETFQDLQIMIREIQKKEALVYEARLKEQQLETIEEHGQVLLNIYVQDDTCLCIDISDNGIGMTEEELARVRKNISEKDTSRTQSIGLYNINQRILLCYGPEYSLNVSSERDKGTTVSLRLPLNKLTE